MSVPLDPRYSAIWADLTSIQRDYNRGERFVVESKDEFRSRVGRSPDHSDALLCSLSRTNPAKVRMRVLQSKGAGKKRPARIRKRSL